MGRKKRRGGIPWRALAIVSAGSLAAGWELAQMQRREGPRHVVVRRAGHTVHPSARSPRPFSTNLPRAGATVPSPMPSATALRPPAVPARPSPSAAPLPGPAVTARGEARLAIIIDDCGQWLSTERALLALPIPLTVSIMPDAPYARLVQQLAADAGQGVMLHLPMEPRRNLTPVKGEITTSMDDAAIQEQVRDDLARLPLARGVNNHEGSKATADPRVMRDVARVLAEEGRYFVDSRTTAATVAAQETEAQSVPTASRNVFLDDVPTVAAVESQLLLAAEQARSRGTAIAIGHPKEAVLEALRAEIPRIEARGVSFALVQDVVE